MNVGRFTFSPLDAVPHLDDVATPWPLSLPAAASLVACPAHPMMVASVQDIYRMAYENALAATRTSRFELAFQACPN